MLKSESLPIKLFIRANLDRWEIKAITEDWRVDFNSLVNILTAHFNDLGMYTVPPEMHKIVQKRMAMFLKSSPEILKSVVEAERKERYLARTKRSLAD